jgi:hypothetical protein
MSKTEILDELATLSAEERREIFERLCDLQEQDLIAGGGPTPEEKAILDQALIEYERDPSAGSPWPVVEARIRASRKK